MKIDINAHEETAIKTSLVYGASGAGKTLLNCTWPRPAWIGSKREGGFETIKFMDKSLFYERDFPPLIYAVSSIAEMKPHLDEAVNLVKTGRIRTIIVELSFYSDDIIRSLTTTDEKNGWAKYATLEAHVTWLDSFVKTLPNVRVAYNALAAPADTDKTPGGILLAGKALSKKIPAMTDLTGYLRSEDRGNNVIDRVLHLAAYGPYSPRHRYGSRLPAFVRNPTYRKLEDLLAGRCVTDTDGNVVPVPKANGAKGASAVKPSGLPPLSPSLPPLPKR